MNEKLKTLIEKLGFTNDIFSSRYDFKVNNIFYSIMCITTKYNKTYLFSSSKDNYYGASNLFSLQNIFLETSDEKELYTVIAETFKNKLRMLKIKDLIND